MELHNLLDDVVYRVYSNLGRGALSRLRRGMFVICRIVPVHPATDAWLVSGHVAAFRKSARREIVRIAAQQVTAIRSCCAATRPCSSGPGGRGRASQGIHRSGRLRPRGAVTARGAGDVARALSSPAAESDGASRRQGSQARRDDRSHTQECGRSPDELLDADSVALIYDESEGLHYYRNFGRLDALFADPALARDRANLSQLREYLHDESVSPLAIRRLVQRHPEGADPVFRALLRKPGFCWSRDGEKLLRREALFDREPTPSISIIGKRLAELLGTTTR